jgi:DNA-binding MarR family transcriptional regulator
MGKVKQENIAPRPETIAAADRLHSAAIHLLRRVRLQDVASGVGPAQLSALSVLVFAGPKIGSPKTLGELAAAEQVKPPTMSRVVAGLKRSHLVTITRDSHDARRLHIRATAKGNRLLQQGRRRRIDYLAVHLDSLTTNELAQLGTAAGILEKLLRTWR